MKGIVQDRYGNADVLQLQEIPTPEPGPNAVLLEVHAASLFVGDWHIMAGLPYAIRPSFGLRKPKVRVRGQDVAGTVVASRSRLPLSGRRGRVRNVRGLVR